MTAGGGGDACLLGGCARFQQHSGRCLRNSSGKDPQRCLSNLFRIAAVPFGIAVSACTSSTYAHWVLPSVRGSAPRYSSPDCRERVRTSPPDSMLPFGDCFGLVVQHRQQPFDRVRPQRPSHGIDQHRSDRMFVALFNLVQALVQAFRSTAIHYGFLGVLRNVLGR